MYVCMLVFLVIQSASAGKSALSGLLVQRWKIVPGLLHYLHYLIK